MHRPRFYPGLAPIILAGIALLLEAPAANALCPSGYECTTDTVAFQTGAPGCNTMSAGALKFPPLPLGSSQTETLRACYCATDGGHPEVDNAGGVEFLKILAQNLGQTVAASDFTVADSGYVINGQIYNALTGNGQVAGNEGCDNWIDYYPQNCPSANAYAYCFADVQFTPNVNPNNGDPEPLMADLSFNTECPNPTSNSGCVDTLPATSSPLFDFTGAPVSLKGAFSGFGILQPDMPTAMSTPTSTTDPGVAKVNFQAQVPSALATATVSWTTELEFRSGKYPVKSLKFPRFNSTGDGSVSNSYTGEGGWLCSQADLRTDAQAIVVPVTGNNPSADDVCMVLNGLLSKYEPSPATSDLLPKLAVTESSLAQFSDQLLSAPPVSTGVHERRDKCRDLAGAVSSYQGLWPTEAANGVAIGLMQINLKETKSPSQREKVAWNWIQNADTGAKTYGSARGTAGRHSQKMVRSDPGLPPLSGQNLEGEALGLYKGFGGNRTTPTIWFLVPQCSSNTSLAKGTCPSGGSWQWVQNPNPCMDGGSSCPNDQKVTYLVGLVFSATDPCNQANEAATQSCGP